MYKKVISIVISSHLIFIMLLLFNSHKIPSPRNKHIAVRTVRPISPTKKIVASAPASKSMPSPKPPPKPVGNNKPATKQPAPTKTPASTKKPPTPQKPAIQEKGKPQKKPEPSQEIWSEIDQALAKIEKKSYPTPKESLALPKPFVYIEDSLGGFGAESEVSHLMSFLHDTLNLPEVGEVKIELTVRKNGTVGKVVILNAESKKNRDYLQKHLPLLQLPMNFNEEKKWVITFCNEV